MAAGEQHPIHTQPQPEERMAGEVGAEGFVLWHGDFSLGVTPVNASG